METTRQSKIARLIQKEISEITDALNNGLGSYTLKYAADIEYVGIFSQPKIKG